MAAKVQMQCKDGLTGSLATWLVAAPDFAGTSYPGSGSPIDIAISGGGFLSVSGGSSAPTGALTELDGTTYITAADGSYLT